MQQERFKIFKSQDQENGHFDVTFEIDGKKLFANKFMLTSVSETLKAMVSDRWSIKDEAVKIEDYSYDNFYEFLCFLYTGSCDLTNENVFKLTDMSEYYGVPLFKEFCGKFLTKMEYNLDNIEEMLEFAEKYSLCKMKAAIKHFVSYYFGKVVSNKRFLSYCLVSFVEFFSLIGYCSKEGIFEAVYKWTEHQVVKQSTDENQKFNCIESVKNKLMFTLLVIYELAEKQALQNQKMSSDGENFNTADSIKADLAEVLLFVRFYKMKQYFLTNFIVAKGIITEEQASHVNDIRVSITNNGKLITGVFNGDIGGIRRAIERSGTYNIARRNTTVIRIVDYMFLIPSTPSIVKKTFCTVWYLCLEKNGFVTLKHLSKIEESDYILAEMKSENGFSLTPDKETSLKACFNNLDPII
uniref:BTB domain-containing protein n=1 Tax=Panagrolaimus sp. PS1159 TaxID=55785 RepID=A0AC35G9J1_9BILA